MIVVHDYHGCIQAEDIDLPLKRNQTLVIKYFNLSRSKFCDKFLGRSQEKEKMRYSIITCNYYHYFVIILREKLLQPEESGDCLRVFLRVISLLAACCEGKNLFIESICQNVISIDEIMKVQSLTYFSNLCYGFYW